MPCAVCQRALEQGGGAVYELLAFHPELLPELPDRALTWREIAEFLVRAAGAVRAAPREPAP